MPKFPPIKYTHVPTGSNSTTSHETHASNKYSEPKENFLVGRIISQPTAHNSLIGASKHRPRFFIRFAALQHPRVTRNYRKLITNIHWQRAALGQNPSGNSIGEGGRLAMFRGSVERAVGALRSQETAGKKTPAGFAESCGGAR